MQLDPFSGALFIYVGRRFDALKKYYWPRLLQQEVVTLTVEQLNWLLDGYDIWTQPHRVIKFAHVS
jgi:hypothetical protein